MITAVGEGRGRTRNAFDGAVIDAPPPFLALTWALDAPALNCGSPSSDFPDDRPPGAEVVEATDGGTNAHLGDEVGEAHSEDRVYGSAVRSRDPMESQRECPSPRVEPRVYVRDRFAITLWTYYEATCC